LQPLRHFETGDLGKLDVHHDQVGMVPAGEIESLDAIAGADGLIAVRLQQVVEELHVELVVFHDQDGLAHCRRPPVHLASVLCRNQVTKSGGIGLPIPGALVLHEFAVEYLRHRQPPVAPMRKRAPSRPSPDNRASCGSLVAMCYGKANRWLGTGLPSPPERPRKRLRLKRLASLPGTRSGSAGFSRRAVSTSPGCVRRRSSRASLPAYSTTSHQTNHCSSPSPARSG